MVRQVFNMKMRSVFTFCGKFFDGCRQHFHLLHPTLNLQNLVIR